MYTERAAKAYLASRAKEKYNRNNHLTDTSTRIGGNTMANLLIRGGLVYDAVHETPYVADILC